MDVPPAQGENPLTPTPVPPFQPPQPPQFTSVPQQVSPQMSVPPPPPQFAGTPPALASQMEPTPATQPQFQPQPIADTAVPYVPPPQKPSRNWGVIIAIIGVLVLVVGGTAYAYVRHIGPFAVSQYSEENFLSSLLEKSSEIDTAAYAFSMNLKVVPREAGAAPLVVAPLSEEKIAAYEHDVRRVSDASAILSNLSYGYGDQQVYDRVTKKMVTRPGKPYPVSLSGLAQTSYQNFSTNDPITRAPYRYQVTEGGKNFMLTVTFETSEAVTAIRNAYGYTATTTRVSGQNVTFTNKSRSYLYIPSTLPTPWLVRIGDNLRYLSPDVSGSFTLGAATDFSNTESPDWSFNINATGDMGDLSYKFDAEARKKGEMYYLRINNFPSVIDWFGISAYKGKWISIDPKNATSTRRTDDDYYSYSPLKSLASSIDEKEKSYKKERAAAVAELRALTTIAEQEKLIAFKTAPVPQTVDGRKLYRYEVTLRKEAIVPFFTKVLERPEQFKKLSLAKDKGLLEYLKSQEFETVFNYVNANTLLTIWTDTAGFPARIAYQIRAVPPDTATALKDKQIMIVLALDLKDVNEPVNIEKPADATTLDEVTDAAKKNTGSALSQSKNKADDAVVQSSLSSIRVSAELYYDDVGKGSYGYQSFVSGNMAKCVGGMFKDKNINEKLASIDAKFRDKGGVACYANGTGYLVGAALTNPKEWWCVDSTGASRKEFGSLPTTLPVGGKCP